MHDKYDLKPDIDILFDDLSHPNPNINYKATLLMVKYWPDTSVKRLIKNLGEKDVKLRRNSVRALSLFVGKCEDLLFDLFNYKKDEVVRISCLKVFTLIASKSERKEEILELINMALQIDSSQISIAAITCLRQLGVLALPKLKEICGGEDTFKAKAALTAFAELNDPFMEDFLSFLLKSTNLDNNIREEILVIIDSIN